MTNEDDDLPLFEQRAEIPGPYRVPTLRAHGDEHRGDWLLLWAEAKHPLHSYQDRAAVMVERGLDPEAYLLYPAAPINILEGGYKRSWWHCWPKHLPPPTA